MQKLIRWIAYLPYSVNENAIDRILSKTGVLNAEAKSALIQSIEEFSAELSELLTEVKDGSIPWWYFWSTWWTEQQEKYCLRGFGDRIIPDSFFSLQ